MGEQPAPATGGVLVAFILLVLGVAVFYLLQRYRSLERRCEQMDVTLQSTVTQEFFKSFVSRGGLQPLARPEEPEPAQPENGPWSVGNPPAPDQGAAVLLVDMMTGGTMFEPFDTPFAPPSHECGGAACPIPSPRSPRFIDVTDSPGSSVDAQWNIATEPLAEESATGESATWTGISSVWEEGTAQQTLPEETHPPSPQPTEETQPTDPEPEPPTLLPAEPLPAEPLPTEPLPTEPLLTESLQVLDVPQMVHQTEPAESVETIEPVQGSPASPGLVRRRSSRRH